MHYLSFLQLVVSLGVTWLVTRIFKKLVQHPSPYPLPPGPPQDPILGGARHIPFTHQWTAFSGWKKKYGDVVYTHVFGSHVLVLNSFKAAKELLDARGAIYSSRPRLVMAREILNWKTALPIMPHGDRFRRHRNWAAKYLNPRSSLEYQPHQIHGALMLLNELLDTPDALMENLERSVVSPILMITYGIEVQRDNDPYVKAVKAGLKAFLESGNHGAMLVDLFPIIKYTPSWLPGAGWKRKAFDSRIQIRAMLDDLLNATLEKRAQGTAKPCIALELIEELEQTETPDPELEEDIRGFAGAIYPAGVETVVSTMSVFILAMVLNPEVVRKAQMEIDRVIGNNRLPDFSDRESLPYIDCIVKETYRWHPVVPLALPHYSLEDDVYDGYLIPGGSTVLPNVWLMMHDDEFFSKPEQFMPERFMKEPGKDEPYDCTTCAFGFGRRVCPGKYFADASVWLNIANILAVFDIKPALDSDGKEILPKLEVTSGMTSAPLPFKCRTIPRNEQTRSLIIQNNPLGS